MSTHRLSSNSKPAPKEPLSNVVNRFATSPETLASERRKLPDSARERLEKLLQEIDETVLPRQLRVMCGDDRVVSLAVANRRLFAMSPEGRPAIEQASPDTYAVHLLELSKSATGLSKAMGVDDVAVANPENSFTAGMLRDALGLDSESKSIDALADRLVPEAIAILSWVHNSDDVAFHGDESWHGFLHAHAERLQLDRQISASGQLRLAPGTTGFVATLCDKTILIAASDTAQGFVAINERQLGLKALSRWQITN